MRIQVKPYLLATLFISFLSIQANAADEAQTKSQDKETVEEKESPWLATPTFSSSPKLGNSIGALGAYLHKFDEKSPTSTLTAMGSYSDTDSSFYGVFGTAYFLADEHRIKIGALKGEIENEYEDYLGTGFNAITTDNVRVSFISYTKRFESNWFLGLQMVGMEYEVLAGDQQTQIILDSIGLSALNSNGIGGVIERDTRDSQNSPQSGSLFNFNSLAFRDSFGGDKNYDTYTTKYNQFFSHGDGHVVAIQVDGRWTHNAPVAAYSSVNLRGYTQGEYLAPNSVTFQAEERFAINDRWGATGFIGAACLYGDEASCDDKGNWYPALGAGVTYMLKVEERMVVRAEFALGKNDSRGFFIQFGNSF